MEDSSVHTSEGDTHGSGSPHGHHLDATSRYLGYGVYNTGSGRYHRHVQLSPDPVSCIISMRWIVVILAFGAGLLLATFFSQPSFTPQLFVINPYETIPAVLGSLASLQATECDGCIEIFRPSLERPEEKKYRDRWRTKDISLSGTLYGRIESRYHFWTLYFLSGSHLNITVSGNADVLIIQSLVKLDRWRSGKSVPFRYSHQGHLNSPDSKFKLKIHESDFYSIIVRNHHLHNISVAAWFSVEAWRFDSTTLLKVADISNSSQTRLNYTGEFIFVAPAKGHKDDRKPWHINIQPAESTIKERLTRGTVMASIAGTLLVCVLLFFVLLPWEAQMTFELERTWLVFWLILFDLLLSAAILILFSKILGLLAAILLLGTIVAGLWLGGYYLWAISARTTAIVFYIAVRSFLMQVVWIQTLQLGSPLQSSK